MPKSHGDKPGAREAYIQTNNTDRGPHKAIYIKWNQSATTGGRKKQKTKKYAISVVNFTRTLVFLGAR